MQVELSASVATGASRAVAPFWSAPLLLEGIFSTTSLQTSLWSNSAERGADRLEGLKDDEQRVADVLEGLGPTGVQQATQAQIAREDVRDAGTARAMRREISQQSQQKSAAGFRSMLDHARGSAGRQAAPPAGMSAAAHGQSAETGAAPANAESTSAGSGTPAAAPGTGRLTDGLPPATGTPASEAARTSLPPAAPMNTASAGATSPAGAANVQPAGAAPNVNLASAATIVQRIEPAGAPTSASPPGSGSPPTVANASPAGASEASDSPIGERIAAERESEQAKPDADERAENVERVLRALRGSLHRERTTTVIRMDPPVLGALRLELDLRKDVLRLRMSAESSAAQELLRDELDALRRGLEVAGIRLERVEIQPLAAPQEPPPFSTLGDSGQRRGETGGDGSASVARRAGAPRAVLPAGDAVVEAASPGPVSSGSARLNVVA